MLHTLPQELLHRIVIYASPLISLSVTPLDCSSDAIPIYFEVNPPAVISRLAQTCSDIYRALKFVDENALLFARVFERTFDFDAARRRLGPDWAGAHGIAWEGRKRWAMIRRMKNAVSIWERDGYSQRNWMDHYGDEDIRIDLWTIYLMLLENDGKNAVLLTQGAKMVRFVEMLCHLHFGKQMVRRIGWPQVSQERALLAWILYALDPMPGDFVDQDMYSKTKLCMRAFIFASFKYSLGILPPTLFVHPSALNSSHYSHQVPATELLPYPLNPYSSARYASWTPPPDPPLYKYSNDPLVPILIYAHTAYLYPPSLAVAALLWYFRGTNAILSPPIVGSPREIDGELEEGYIPAQALSKKLLSGIDTPSTSASTDSAQRTEPSASSYPSSAARSLFAALSTDPHSWTTPLLFAIPPAPPNLSQPTLNQSFRNELYRRRFNAASRQLDQEWTRRLEGQMRFNGPSRVEGFIPGSLEGVWEGGFLYLDFPDYAQFLTGEREATPDFYQLPPEKVYGSNRQVWKLKEYELQTFPDEDESASFTGNSLLLRNRYSSPGRNATMYTNRGMSSSMTSSSRINEPLSVGKWMNGWLPPADTLNWCFTEGGDELEIAETIRAEVAVKRSLSGRRAETRQRERDGFHESLAASFSTSAKAVVTGSDEDDAEGSVWRKEKEAFVKKIRGRAPARPSIRPVILEVQPGASSVPPVARPLSTLAGEVVLTPPPVISPTSSGNIANSRTIGGRALSPPPAHSPSPLKNPKEGKTRFSWGWKSGGPKSKKGLADVSSEDQDQTAHPVYYRESPPRKQGNLGAAARSPKVPSSPPIREERERPLTEDRKRDLIEVERKEDDEKGPDGTDEVGDEGKREVVEKVSRYVRWDPNVAWAKQAIWGSRTTGGSAGSSQRGKVSGATDATGATGTTSSIPGPERTFGSTRGGTGLSKTASATSTNSQARRQVNDILVFGESHSSWGEATIRGRVRAHDGLVTLVKTYPHRATWIYTGYVVAGENFVGRWRDAKSPEEVNGYEGPFAMKRRR